MPQPWETPLPPDVRTRLEQDIRRQCEEHGLSWRQDEQVQWTQAEGDLDGRWFRTPPLRYEIDYWVAMHEVGHFGAGDLPTEAAGRVLWENEEAVWNWALDNAAIEPSGSAQGWIYASFFSYPDDPAPADVRARARARIGEGGFDPLRFKVDGSSGSSLPASPS